MGFSRAALYPFLLILRMYYMLNQFPQKILFLWHFYGIINSKKILSGFTRVHEYLFNKAYELKPLKSITLDQDATLIPKNHLALSFEGLVFEVCRWVFDALSGTCGSRSPHADFKNLTFFDIISGAKSQCR
jgi:hypothetical protein